MSNIYISEPTTSGKILLQTTTGELDIELWAKEAPRACRSFVQRCLDGQYDGVPFCRVIPDFVVQSGTPGKAGDAQNYDAPFKLEIHQRLRFSHRGLLALAAEAKDGETDMGEFFFTLSRADHLNRKHTIFGKVSGTTVFNMLRLAEVELGPGDEVINPHSIRSTEVLSNPFEELVPRPRRFKESENSGLPSRTCQALPHRNLSLLSFGDEAAEEEGQMIQTTQELRGKSKSSHDLLLNDYHLSSIPVTTDMVTSIHKDKVACKAEESKTLVSLSQDSITEKGQKVREEKEDETEGRKRDSSKLIAMLHDKSKKPKREIDLMKETEDAETKTTVGDWEKLDVKTKDAKINANQGSTDKFQDATTLFKEKKKRQGKESSREAQTLILLEQFRGRLSEARQPKSPVTTDVKHQTSNQLDGDDDAGWMSHSLFFSDVVRNARDANTPSIYDYSIHDPRHPLSQRRRKGGKGSELDKVKEEEERK